MCIVIDVDTIPSVFNSNASDHLEFKPVNIWIYSGRGKMVYGDTKYKEELGRLENYYDILAEFWRKGRVQEVRAADVDRVADEVSQITSGTSFDDQHIAAIVIVSRCRLICTHDKTSMRFLTNTDLYPKGARRPSIYSGLQNRRLLYDRRIVQPCGPCKSHA